VLTVHIALGVAVVVVCVGSAVLGFVAYRRRGSGGAFVSHALVLAQTLLIAQVAIGLLLVSDDRRAPDELHYAYGTLSLLAALSPWLYAPAEPRRRLAWFVGATLLAGALATRAYLTSG
jgi:heme A synthase